MAGAYLQSMVSSGTKEHLDFLTYLNEERAGHGELEFESVSETPSSLMTEIKVNMSTKAARNEAASIEVRSQYAARVSTSCLDSAISLSLTTSKHHTRFVGCIIMLNSFTILVPYRSHVNCWRCWQFSLCS